MSRTTISLGLLVLLGCCLAGCAANTTSYVRDDVDFSYIRRVAVYPFVNRSQDPQAAPRVYSIFQAELLQHDALRTIDLGETLGGLQALRLDPAAVLAPEQIVALGKQLGVDGIFFGDVDDYGLERASGDRVYSVTFTFSLAETETGSVVWQSTVHDDGTSLWRKLFGGGTASLHDVSRSAIADALETLF
ncbi:MAG: hypothetical protein R3D98_06715 [Candidatus Krumholzibacteriia bacterium]